MSTHPAFSDELAAPLLLQLVAAQPRERGLRRVVEIDCFGLLDHYVDEALGDCSAPDYLLGGHLNLDGVKRSGERLPLAAAAWTRRLLRGPEDICGPSQRGRLRLRHSGCPSSFHLKAVAHELQAFVSGLGVTTTSPFAAVELFDRPAATPAAALLKAAAALQGGSLTTAEQLAVTAARGLFTPERAMQIVGGKAEAKKARAVVRKKIREALAAGSGSISLNCGHLSAAGNSQVAACVNAGLSLWQRSGLDGRERISAERLVLLLAELADERVSSLAGDFATELRKRSLIRSRPSGLAQRTAR